MSLNLSDLFWLTDERMVRLQPCFPKRHGRERVDDRRARSGIATRDDRRPTAFFSAVAPAAAIIFWL